MDANGKIHIGLDYKEKSEQVEKLTGKRDSEAVRQIVENIIFDAQQQGLTSVPIQKIGIKTAA